MTVVVGWVAQPASVIARATTAPSDITRSTTTSLRRDNEARAAHADGRRRGVDLNRLRRQLADLTRRVDRRALREVHRELVLCVLRLERVVADLDLAGLADGDERAILEHDAGRASRARDDAIGGEQHHARRRVELLVAADDLRRSGDVF